MLIVGFLFGFIVADVNRPIMSVDYTPPIVHQYDYILEVDGTDSIEHMYIFDNKHNPVGDFYTSSPDSLQIIIDQDNL